MCSEQNTGDSVQLTAQFTSSDGSTTPMSALSNDHGCGTAAQMMLTSSKDFPRLKKIHSIELLSTVSMQHVHVVWHNAHP